MDIDAYNQQLSEMIALFQEYKSGSVTLENITKLCQTLRLESFIDDIDTDTARLSTASKIIVIDIDFDKHQKKVTDVKLVLASNFDNFNYFIDPDSSTSKTNNILLNSLTQYPDLHEFHSNLKYLYLLDNFSNIDIDASNSNNFGLGNNSGNEGTNYNGNNNGKLDLFRYFTELGASFTRYFKDNSFPFVISTNLNNSFGIYILSGDRKVLAKLYFEQSKDPSHRLYEFLYTEDTKEWTNISSENYTNGLSLIMEIKSENCLFPQDFILQDMIIEGAKTENNDGLISPKTGDLNDLITKSKNNTNVDDRILLMNDFTTRLIEVKKFDISNDNVDILPEILRWIQWSESILKSTYFLILNISIGATNNTGDSIENNPQINMANTRRRSSAGQKRRRFSNKSRRPSITESAMLKDEGLQQFNLHEIMADTNQNTQSTLQNTAQLVKGIPEDDKMDIDSTNIVVEGIEHPQQLLVSEDHVSLNKVAKCSLYEDMENWSLFIETLKDMMK